MEIGGIEFFIIILTQYLVFIYLKRALATDNQLHYEYLTNKITIHLVKLTRFRYTYICAVRDFILKQLPLKQINLMA